MNTTVLQDEELLALGRAFLAAQELDGEVLLCAITGAHAYGFPSPDSDIDLKGIHLAPTQAVLGLSSVPQSFDRLQWVDGVEYDLTTNECRKALGLLLSGNGNMLERIFSPLQLVEGAELEQLRALAGRALSRRFARHYQGFFKGICREHEREPSSKTLLYAYRVTLTGVSVLRGEGVELDLRRLAERQALTGLEALIAHKASAGEHSTIDARLDADHRARWPMLEAMLEAAEAESTLPLEAPNFEECSAWLAERRLRAAH